MDNENIALLLHENKLRLQGIHDMIFVRAEGTFLTRVQARMAEPAWFVSHKWWDKIFKNGILRGEREAMFGEIYGQKSQRAFLGHPIYFLFFLINPFSWE